ncbi:MAG: beta-ketoacyl-[acyl-carrier-protein] synthase II, partial [Muribaculaceae bacterium]|nr:beta-ketoacyl-[acyl-carrier-protein] synthase II [Muribaculaceae bacterium]
AVFSVKTITDGVIPPTINHVEGDDDPQVDNRLNFTFNKAVKKDVKTVLSNTFGFGGHNAAIILKKYEG